MLKFNNLLGENETDDNIDVKLTRDNLKQKIPWVDKYRPKKLDDIVQQDEVIKVLKDTLKTGNLPHLLFYGPPGTGKTSSVLAIAMELFGPVKFHERVIELNASDERGINVVRHKIITFAKSAIGNSDPNYPCPPYKIVILDEADAMTTEAQSALRKVMENLSKITRFCFICNYINQIIDPISSRCMKFRFKSIESSIMNNKLSFIANKENLALGNDIINAISVVSKGDVRKAIMTLQNLKYKLKLKTTLVENDVYEITNMLPSDKADDIWNKCIFGDDNIENIIDATNKLKQFGYPINSILEQFKNKIVDSDIPDDKKGLISIQIAITERRLIEGADEHIQLLNVICYIKGVICDIIKYYPSSIC